MRLDTRTLKEAALPLVMLVGATATLIALNKNWIDQPLLGLKFFLGLFAGFLYTSYKFWKDRCGQKGAASGDRAAAGDSKSEKP